MEPRNTDSDYTAGETIQASPPQKGFRFVGPEVDHHDWIIIDEASAPAEVGSLAWADLLRSFHEHVQGTMIQLHTYEDVLLGHRIHTKGLIFDARSLVGESDDPWAIEPILEDDADETEAIFADLAEEWKRDILVESSFTARVMHRAYQNIIGLGPAVVPYILRELQREPNHWFWALAAITREDPAEGQETIDGAAQKWLEWGRMRGLI